MLERHPEIGVSVGTVNCVVTECNDGRLNDIRGMHLTEDDFIQALDSADVTFDEGAVGGGRGMVCREKLDDVGSCDIVNDFDSFKKVAAKGHNPRKFLAFNDEFLQQLTTVKNRQRIAKKFNIPMIKDRFDSSCPETSDKLIKILCNRGMVDPFGNDPVEVAGSKKWE